MSNRDPTQEKKGIPAEFWVGSIVLCFLIPPLGMTLLAVLGVLFILNTETGRETTKAMLESGVQALSDQHKPAVAPAPAQTAPENQDRRQDGPRYRVSPDVLSIEEGIPAFLEAKVDAVKILASFAICSKGEGNFRQVRYARFLAYPVRTRVDNSSFLDASSPPELEGKCIFGKKSDLHLQDAYFNDALSVRRREETEFLSIREAPLSALEGLPKSTAIKSCLIFCDLIEALASAKISGVFLSDHPLEKMDWVDITMGFSVGKALDEGRAVDWEQDRLDVSEFPDIAEMYATAYINHDRCDLAKLFLKESAQRGNAQAQLLLGICLASLAQSRADHLAALKWVLASAKQKHSDAECQMGKAFLSGNHIPANRAEAEKWFRLAATNESLPHPPAMFFLAKLLLESPAETARQEGSLFMDRSADAGFQPAITFLSSRAQ